jgi:hypothetical protein
LFHPRRQVCPQSSQQLRRRRLPAWRAYRATRLPASPRPEASRHTGTGRWTNAWKNSSAVRLQIPGRAGAAR